MMMIKDIVAANSIKFGSIYIPGSAIESVLCTTVRPILIEYKIDPADDNYRLARSGSAHFVSMGSKRFSICTKHQLFIKGTDISAEQLSCFKIMSNKKGVADNILTETFLHETACEEEEFHDLVAFQVKSESLGFYDANSFIDIGSYQDGGALASFFIGCPMDGSEIDDDKKTIKLSTKIMKCTRDAEYKSNASYLDRYIYNGDDDLDGCSGGAVYSLVGDASDLKVRYDGAILRGGNGFLYVLQAEYVREFLSIELKT